MDIALIAMANKTLLKSRDSEVLIGDGIILDLGRNLPVPADTDVIDVGNCLISSSFVDVHVHFREPGYSYKETIASGSRAAARGGYGAVCTMPNLDPVPDTPEHIAVQQEIIDRDAVIDVFPYASITIGRKGSELVDMDALKDACIAFSDDGSGVQDDEMMRAAMKKAAEIDAIIAAHCEDNSLLRGGYIHDGRWCAAHGHKGICSESEWGQIARDLKIAEETGCRYHVCHISTKESVQLIREAKTRGVKVTCETGPHYLVLCEDDMQEEGRFKMNPPLRSAEDRDALVEGLLDGTIDVVATDHAPHSAEEKSRGLAGSAMGVVGIETAFPVLYTGLVKTGRMTMERLLEVMSAAPRRLFGIGGGLEKFMPADLVVIDLEDKYTIDTADFLSIGKATPFEGAEVYGRVKMTFKDGNIVYKA